MDVAAFSRTPVGRLLPIEGYDARLQKEYRHHAFLPDPLPETIALGGRTWAVVAESMKSLGRLDQAGRQVPNASLIRRPAIRREAVSTSALEGTHAAFTDVLEAEVDPVGRERSPEVAEVLNYVRAAEYAFASVPARGITMGLLSELQAILVQGTRAEERDPGRVRTHQVVIGPEGCPVEEARFVPPPPGDLLEGGFRDWTKWISGTRELPGVVQAALAHYQFETLHPYHDGNGRIGRLVIVLHLMALGELQDPLLTVSPWLEARRQEYQDSLLEVSKTGDFDQGVRFFCTAVDAQARQTVDKITDLLAFQEDVRLRMREANIKGVAAQIAEDLVAQPLVTSPFAARHYGVTYQAANSAIKKLTGLGILSELTGRTYDRIFGSREVLRVIER